jgi:ATP-binding cassette subfamily B protein
MASSDKSVSRLLWNSFGTQWPRFAGAVVATIAAAILGFAVPLLVQAVLDWVLTGGGAPPFRWVVFVVNAVGGPETLRRALWIPTLLIIAVTAGNGLASYLAGRWSAEGAEISARRLRDRLYERIHAVSISWHQERSSGDILQRCTSDVDTVRKFFAIQLMELGRAAAMTAVAVPVMVRLHPRLTLVAVTLLPVAFWYTLRFFHNVQIAFTASDEAEGELSAMLQEHLNGLRVVRAFAREPEQMAAFAARNEEHRRVTLHLLHLLARYWSVSSFLVILQLGAVLVTGTLFAVEGELTVGGLLVFLMLEQMLLWPIRQMGMILADLGKARVAMGRIAEVLNAPTEDEDPRLRGPGTLSPRISGAVTFEDVWFSYPEELPGEGEILPVSPRHDDRERPATLNGVSFSVPAGTSVGILGSTGSGKSTMMMLLARLYDPDRGRILIDGVDIATIDRRWMRRHVALVLQEPFLFARTIRDNISLARSAAHEAEIVAATRSAAVHTVIESFSEGYDTAVGERGVTLSGGQKQRVAIARALITGSPVLVFDDSLSAVDTRTDARIRAALLDRGVTTFLISHRATTLARTDHLIVIEEGRIIEQGPPEELLERGGHFARTWDVQQGATDADDA